MIHCQSAEKLEKDRAFWLRDIPPERQCQAKNRRGERCGFWTVRGKRVCWRHGGRSAGAKSQEGVERIKIARTTHGKYAIDKLKVRTLVKFSRACYLKRASRINQVFVCNMIKGATWENFCRIRRVINAFCLDQATERQVVEAITGPQRDWRLERVFEDGVSPEPMSTQMVEEYLAGDRKLAIGPSWGLEQPQWVLK